MAEETTWYRAIHGSDRIQSLTGTPSSTGNSLRSTRGTSTARKSNGWHESREDVRREQLDLARKRVAMMERSAHRARESLHQIVKLAKAEGVEVADV